MPRAPRKQTEADQLAALCAGQRTQLVSAGRRMHDDIGPMLSAAGLRLQLLRMDVPQAAEATSETIEMLDAAFEHLRSLSQELLASPAYRGGLRQALARLAEGHPEISLLDTSAARVPAEAAGAIYEFLTAAVDAALTAGARSIVITVTGKARLSVRVADDGRAGGRAAKLALAARLAALARVRVDLTTKQGRIVFIRYALRRPARG